MAGKDFTYNVGDNQLMVSSNFVFNWFLVQQNVAEMGADYFKTAVIHDLMMAWSASSEELSNSARAVSALFVGVDELPESPDSDFRHDHDGN